MSGFYNRNDYVGKKDALNLVLNDEFQSIKEKLKQCRRDYTEININDDSVNDRGYSASDTITNYGAKDFFESFSIRQQNLKKQVYEQLGKVLDYINMLEKLPNNNVKVFGKGWDARLDPDNQQHLNMAIK